MGREEYVASFVEESLGLPVGIISVDRIPGSIIREVESAVRGDEPEDPLTPTVEKQLSKFSEEMEGLMLSSFGVSAFKERWPNGSEYAVALTHDVDNIERPLKHIIRIRNRFRPWDLFLHVVGLRSLYKNIGYAANIERKLGVRSTFFLLTSNYSLGNIANEVKRLRYLGWEFGLHGGEGTHDSENLLAEDIRRFVSELGFRPEGLREHYLKFDFDKTWGIAERNLISYDSTVGNTNKLGFRIGICTPFHPPDKEWKMMKIMELPLVLMDTTLWGYLKRDEAHGLRDVVEMKERVRSVGGLFTILWHTESLRMRGGRIYPRILDMLKQDNAYVSNAGNVARWWKRRRKARLYLQKDRVRVEDAEIGLTLRLTSNKKIGRVAGGYIERSENFIRLFCTSKVAEASFE